jgi:hypothetical protein
MQLRQHPPLINGLLPFPRSTDPVLSWPPNIITLLLSLGNITLHIQIFPSIVAQLDLFLIMDSMLVVAGVVVVPAPTLTTLGAERIGLWR